MIMYPNSMYPSGPSGGASLDGLLQDWTAIDVTASRDLLITDWHQLYSAGDTKTLSMRYLHVLTSPVSTAVTLTIPDDEEVTPEGYILAVYVDSAQTGVVSIALEAGGTFDGGSTTAIIIEPGKWGVFRVKSNAASNPVIIPVESGLALPVSLLGKAVGGNIVNVTTTSGALTASAHSGHLIITSGNITVPTTAGFHCTIKAGGAHTVTFNGTTSAAMATGDIMTVIVQTSTVIIARLSPVANQVAFA